MTSSGRLYYNGPDDAATRAALRQTGTPSIDMTVNIGRSRGFIADRSGRNLAGADGLRLDDDEGDLDERLRQLRAQEASLKLQRLLERAQRALEAQRVDTALALVDEALGVNRTSPSAWLVKAQCHLALRQYDLALQAVAVAREHAPDGRAQSVAHAVRTACERQELRDFEAELAGLVEQDRLAEATARVERRLHDQPDNAGLRHHHGLLLMLAGRTDEARHVVNDALRDADDATADRLTTLLAEIGRREGLPRIEQAREALRDGDARGALTHLDACAAAFGGDERFVALRAYAQERAARTRRAGPGRLVRWRQRDEQAAPIPYPMLQGLIEWLVGDELDAGLTALAGDDFDAAAGWFGRAEEIDDRCAAVAFLYGVALFRGLESRFEHDDRPPSLDAAEATLRTAARLAARAVDDPDVGRQSRNLGAAVEANLTALARIRVQIERSQAVAAWVTEFNTLVTHYQRFPIRTYDQRAVACRAFRTLARNVAGARGLHEPDTVEARVLADLTTALQKILRQLNCP